MGRVIAQKLAGSALQAVWVRISPFLQDLVKSAQFWRQQADEHTKAVERIEEATKDIPDLLDAATAEIARLRAENAILQERLAKHEPEEPPQSPP